MQSEMWNEAKRREGRMLPGCSECKHSDRVNDSKMFMYNLHICAMLAPTVYVYNPTHAISCPLQYIYIHYFFNIHLRYVDIIKEFLFWIEHMHVEYSLLLFTKLLISENLTVESKILQTFCI